MTHSSSAAPSAKLHTRHLGRSGPAVSSPGLGCMGMSGAYGPTDDDESVRTIHAYLDAGGTLLDTGDFYAAGHNELLVGRALRERGRDDAVLSVKFGELITPAGMPVGVKDARPAAVRNFLTYSLRRLGTDHVDIYRPARRDPQVPIEDTIGAIAELVEQGYVRHIGLSEVDPDTIRRAAAVAPISDVQIEYSLLSRDIEDDVLSVCRELGIGITAYGVLSKGLIGGSGATGGALPMLPRFQPGNREHNQALVSGLAEIAERKHATVAQVAIAWVAAQGEDIVPVVGSRRPGQIESMIASTAVTLDREDLARIDELVPKGAAKGARYPEQHMPNREDGA